MPDNEVKLIFSGDSRKLKQSLTRGGKHIESFSKKAMRDVGRFGKRMTKMFSMGPLGQVLTGAALLAAGKKGIGFEKRLARLAIQGNLTKKEMVSLRDKILSLSDETNQKPLALLEGIEAIVERTGNIKFAQNIVKELGIISTAEGAAAADIGATASNLQEKFNIDASQILNVFDILTAQGKSGSFTLQNMASLFERLLSAAGRFDIKGVEGIRKFGAFLQIARRGAGSSEQATTAVERTIADLIAKAKAVRKVTGFSIFDKEKSKAAGRAVMKEFDIVLKEIVKRTKGDTTKLQRIFGEESIRAITPLAQSFQKFGDFREFDQFIKLGGDGTMIMKDFAFWMDTIGAKADKGVSKIDQFINMETAGLYSLIDNAAGFADIKRVPTPPGTPTINGWEEIPAAIWQGWKNIYEMGMGERAQGAGINNINNIDITIDDRGGVTAVSDNHYTQNNVSLNRGVLIDAR